MLVITTLLGLTAIFITVYLLHKIGDMILHEDWFLNIIMGTMVVGGAFGVLALAHALGILIMEWIA